MGKKRYPALPVAILIIVLFTACAKSPEWTGDTVVSIEPVDSKNGGKYRVTIMAAVYNRTSNTAFLDLEGTIDTKNSSSVMFSLPFSLEVLLPFSQGIIEAGTELDYEEVLDLAIISAIDKEQFLEEKMIKDSFVSGDSIEVRISKYDRIDIVKLLREKTDEIQ